MFFVEETKTLVNATQKKTIHYIRPQENIKKHISLQHTTQINILTNRGKEYSTHMWNIFWYAKSILPFKQT